MAEAAVTAADVAAAEETRQQQAVMRSLRVFVDALRDIKKPDTAPAEMQRAVRALCQAPDERWSEAQCLENAWRTGIVPLLQRLCLCMERLERIEAQQAAKRTAKASADKPKAPVGLLSLRDYSVLQAAIEILLCWAVYPRMESGILTPIERRRPTRTLAISVFVLGWGARGPPPDDDGDDLLRITQVMMHVLYLPQFQPILLPKYTLELLAMVIYGGEVKSGVRVETEAEFRRLRDQMIQTLPLKLAMGSLRAALGQSTGRSSAASAFMKRGSRLMSQLSMEDGGVMTIIEILLGGVDEGNTQARIQVATLICQCPSGVEPDTYAKKLCRQVKGLLSASNRASKLLCEMGVVLTDHLASRYPDIVELHLLMPLFDPLLRYETKNYKATGNQVIVADEEELSECVTLAHLLVCGPPPSQNLLQILAPIFRPLIHMYAFASNSKSFHRQPLQDILVAWIKLSSWSAIFLQIAVLPVELPDRSSFKTSGKDLQSGSQAAALRNEFCAGGNGGIAIRRIAPSNEEEEAIIRHNLQAVIEPLVELLTLKNLESVAVVGDLFASLLLTYMDVRTSTRKSGATNSRETLSEKSVLGESLRAYEVAKVPSTPLGVEMVLMLLLSITESLGPAVLRSAETILRCIATVLTTFSGQTTRLVDSVEDTSTLIDATDSLAADDEEESVEMLTICLGVVMTILEAGSTHRSVSEEAELKRMLPVLEELSHHPKPDIAELGSEARVRILSRDAVSEDAASKSQKQESFAQVLKRAEDDLKSALVPLRARGVVTLTKLVRASQLHRGEQEWTPRIELLIKIFLRHIEDTESYVFLAAVQGLSTLADIHPDVAIPLLVAALQDQKRQYTLETRIKLSEALLFAAKRCGETLPKYAKVFVYAYLDCIRPTVSPKQVKAAAKRVALIQEIPSKTETETSAQSQSPPAPTQTLASAESSGGASQMEEATLRASCLSNLAEVCALLQWSLQPFAVDVITCVVGVLQLELDNAPSEPSIGLTPVKTLINASASKDDLNASKTESKTSSLPPPAPSPVIAVRRGAVFVLKYLIQLLGWKLLEILPDQLASVYQTLKHVSRTDRDNVVIFHAQGALDALSEVMRTELFPRVEQQDEAFGISSKLRIV